MLLSSMEGEQVTCLKPPALGRTPTQSCGSTADIPQAHFGPICDTRPLKGPASISPTISEVFLQATTTPLLEVLHSPQRLTHPTPHLPPPYLHRIPHPNSFGPSNAYGPTLLVSGTTSHLGVLLVGQLLSL